MAIKTDLSHLPTPARTSETGRAPDPTSSFLAPYFADTRERHEAEGERPHAVAGTRFRHSMAAGCARAVAYHALGVEKSNPMDLTGMLVTGNGTNKHDEVQAILIDRLGDSIEVEVGCQIDGFDGSGNADGLQVVGDLRVCWEHKNVGGFAFKMAVGERGTPQGPKHAHVVQGALNALALDADLMVITYLTWEAISVNIAKRKGLTEEQRISAQWTYQRSEWEPLAQAEVARVTGILNLLDEGTLPARKYPDPELPAGAVITDPASGQWRVNDDEGNIIDTGTWWACGYCDWKDLCQQTPAGRAAIADVPVLIGRAA